MIFFVVPEGGSFSFRDYLNRYGKALAERADLLFYPELPHLQRLPFGSYVFTALDRLSSAETEMVIQIWDRLSQAGPELRLLNDPRRAMKRYELLRTLKERGKNSFQAYRASEWRQCRRFPVFVREENDHNGSLTQLLDSPAAVKKALVWLALHGFRFRELLIVEYCHTADKNGIFRKYSAYVVAGEVIARGIVFSNHWLTKGNVRQFDPEWVREEQRYVEQNPHELWLREVFREARIDYGRIDYGLQGDKPQVWEVNMNPTVSGGPVEPGLLDQQWYRDLRAPIQDHFYRRFQAAWEAIDCAREPLPGIPFAISPELRHRAQLERQKEHRARSYKVFLTKPPGRRFLRRVKRGLTSILRMSIGGPRNF